MDNYYKIKVHRDDSIRCWIGEGHGSLYLTTEKMALVLSDVAVKSRDIANWLDKHKYEYEFIMVDKNKSKSYLVFDDEYIEYKGGDVYGKIQSY